MTEHEDPECNESGMLASPWFWGAGLVSLLIWAVLAWLIL